VHTLSSALTWTTSLRYPPPFSAPLPSHSPSLLLNPQPSYTSPFRVLSTQSAMAAPSYIHSWRPQRSSLHLGSLIPPPPRWECPSTYLNFTPTFKSLYNVGGFIVSTLENILACWNWPERCVSATSTECHVHAVYYSGYELVHIFVSLMKSYHLYRLFPRFITQSSDQHLYELKI
jgi:hypothetical protein